MNSLNKPSEQHPHFPKLYVIEENDLGNEFTSNISGKVSNWSIASSLKHNHNTVFLTRQQPKNQVNYYYWENK